MKTESSESHLLSLTADIVSAHVANNQVSLSDVPTLIASVYNKLESIENPEPK